MTSGSALDPDILAAPRRGRRAAAIAALVLFALLVLDVTFLVLANLGRILVLGVLVALFLVASWTALSIRRWWRWPTAGIAALAAFGALVDAVAIGVLWAGATVALFVLGGAFALLARYALGDRLELEL